LRNWKGGIVGRGVIGVGFEIRMGVGVGKLLLCVEGV